MKGDKPKNLKNNVHFWLRKVYYFVAGVEEGYKVEIQHEESTPGKIPPDRTEKKIREDLEEELVGYDLNTISQKEALEACEKLYAMFNERLDQDVVEFISDPRCPGAKPRTST